LPSIPASAQAARLPEGSSTRNRLINVIIGIVTIIRDCIIIIVVISVIISSSMSMSMSMSMGA